MSAAEPHEFFLKGAKAWQAMHAKNVSFNLKFRWKELKKGRPELAKTLGFVPKVLREGFAVITSPKADFAYTVGLSYLHGQKDLLLHLPGLKASARKAKATDELNALAALIVAGRRVDAGGKLGGHSFSAFTDADLERFPCTALTDFDWLFADRRHQRGSTVPVLWAAL